MFFGGGGASDSAKNAYVHIFAFDIHTKRVTLDNMQKRITILALTGLLAVPFSALSAPKDDAAKKPATKVTKKSKAKKKEPKPALKANKSAKLVSPGKLISSRAQRILTQLKSRPLSSPDAANRQIEVEAGAARGPWIKEVYERKMVEASWATEMLTDKRLLAEVLGSELGAKVGKEKAQNYLLKTVGLREFLTKRNLVDSNGQISATGEKIEEALWEEFPSGFIARPAAGIAPYETGGGLFASTDAFILELLRPDTKIYTPEHLRSPVKSSVLGAIASGEAIVLQENVVAAANARKKLKTRYFHPLRIHTYESRVVEGAIPDRWVQVNLLSKEQIAKAEAFVGEFLKNLPSSILVKQAWGVDVAVLDNGEMRIIDISTNRGKPGVWSIYLDQPRVIGAYSRHFENHYGLRFKGISGTLIRNNMANYMPYWEKRIERARPGWSKVMAYIPPLP